VTYLACRGIVLGLCLLFVDLLCLGVGQAQAAGSITGLVRDSAGKLLPGARVQLRLGLPHAETQEIDEQQA
jgi:hypothetical protein